MTDNTIVVSASSLVRACQLLLDKVGVPEDEAAIIARVVVEADLRGIESHGILRLPAYIHRVQAGLMTPRMVLQPVRERGASALLDAQHGFGQVAGVRAMEDAIRRAREYGVGFVGVRNANHFGIAAYYAMMALPQRMIGVVCANAAPSMAAFGGTAAVLGSNPICAAVPTGGDVDIVLDMASSVVARGKIRLAAAEGHKIPLGWALDAEGHPTEDPQAALDGTLLPIGGPKGYGLALVVDILAGALTGSDFGTDIASVHELDHQTSVGFTVQALDVAAFADWSDFERDMRSLTQHIVESPRAPGVERIYLPGEIEWLKKQQRLRTGIPVPHSLLAQLTELAEEVGVSLDFLSSPSQ